MKKQTLIPLFFCLFSLLSLKTFGAPWGKSSLKPHTIENETSCDFTPWFAGTMLEPSSTNQDPGDVNFQPYFFYSTSYGEYQNNWSLKSISNFSQTISNILLQIGITKHVQLETIIQTQSTFFKGKTSSHFSDYQLGLGIQLLWDKKGEFQPNLRLVLAETFPTGTFENLDPHFLGNDATGKGSYTSSATLDVSKILYFIPCHPLYFNANIELSYSTPVSIRGVSAYGSDPLTKGKLGPIWGCSLTISSELSITQNWVFGFDLRYLQSFSTHFTNFTNLPTPKVATNNTSRLSFTPCIEYNFKQNLGLIFGGSFSFAGKNIDAIAEGIVSLTYVF